MVGSAHVYHPPVGQYDASKTEIVNKRVNNLSAWYISCSTLAKNEILTATPEYLCANSHWCYNNDSKLRASKRKSDIQDGGFENSVAQISADIYVSNEIPTSTPIFLRSGNT